MKLTGDTIVSFTYWHTQVLPWEIPGSVCLFSGFISIYSAHLTGTPPLGCATDRVQMSTKYNWLPLEMWVRRLSCPRNVTWVQCQRVNLAIDSGLGAQLSQCVNFCTYFKIWYYSWAYRGLHASQSDEYGHTRLSHIFQRPNTSRRLAVAADCAEWHLISWWGWRC